MEYFNQFECDFNKDYSLIIEADRRVGYAYLLKNEEIISDVWISNQIIVEEEIDFENPDLMPFLNPNEYVIQPNQILLDFEPIKIEWKYTNENDIQVFVEFKDNRFIVLETKIFPGWSSIVKIDGPLAKVVVNE